MVIVVSKMLPFNSENRKGRKVAKCAISPKCNTFSFFMKGWVLTS
jgi:hypothetical protein